MPDVSVPGDITVEATGGGAVVTLSASASDIVDPAISPRCSPASGSTFAITTTTVNCTATDNAGNSAADSFTVKVEDTTPPAVTVPGNITTAATGPSGAVVTFSASATDLVDTSVTPSCSPPSGSVFPVGTTTVTCTATDDSGNSAQGTFTVTVTDTTPPTVNVPGDITVEATGSGGAVVTYAVSASDNFDPAPTIACSPPSGSTFPIATTTVSCAATDDSGNTSAPKTFTITVRDTTPPTVVVPADITTEATGPSGASVTFVASANDAVDGAIAPSCSPASGTTFAITATTVTCTATDGHANTANEKFKVTVRDTLPPTFGSVPSGITAEADGPGGSRVTYVPPTAVDIVSGPVLVACTPGPGALFVLGTSTVTCTAKDARGTTATVTFAVKVVDTTKPTLNVPQAQTFSSTGAPTLSSSDPKVAAFLASASANDIVAGPVPVQNDAPAVLPLGRTRITFTAADPSGNTATAQSDLTVVTSAVAPKTQDTTPPKDVTRLKATSGDGVVLLTWTPPKTDFHHVTVSRTPGRGSVSASVIFSGSAKQLKDTKLTNGVEYRYVVVAHDAAGNVSSGAIVRAVPKRALLFAPAAGAAVTKPPLLRWVSVAGATYYNVQLYRGRPTQGAPAGTKILSSWPTRPQIALARTWKYNGRPQRLTPGTYVWLAWPGFGPKSANRYGPVIGQSTFVVKASR